MSYFVENLDAMSKQFAVSMILTINDIANVGQKRVDLIRQMGV